VEIEVLEEKENPLLDRKELTVRIIHNDATPKKIDVKKKIEALKTAAKGTVVVDSFKSKYGARESIGLVKIYKSKEAALRVEPEHILKKNMIIGDGKEAEAEKPAKEGESQKQAKEEKSSETEKSQAKEGE
jgi:small subunit ribosomal protein S24e